MITPFLLYATPEELYRVSQDGTILVFAKDKPDVWRRSLLTVAEIKREPGCTRLNYNEARGLEADWAAAETVRELTRMGAGNKPRRPPSGAQRIAEIEAWLASDEGRACQARQERRHALKCACQRRRRAKAGPMRLVETVRAA